MPINQLTLAETILRFRTDAELAHDFVKGDPTLDVVGEEGSYPSLAKLTLLANNSIVNIIDIYEERSKNLVVKKYVFDSTLIVNIKHDLNVSFYKTFIKNVNGDVVYAPIDDVSDNEFNIYFTEEEQGFVIVEFYLNM